MAIGGSRLTAWLAYAGGSLLAAATLPQMVKLLRSRSAEDFDWAFTGMNFVGLMLFAYRSWEIGERAFLIVNCLTATFWGLVLGVKAATRHAARRAPPAESGAAPAAVADGGGPVEIRLGR